MWQINSRTAVWDWKCICKYLTLREAIVINFTIRVTMIITVSFKGTLFVWLIAVQSNEMANRSSFQHLFVNSMTNRRQLQYNIPFFLLFFFYKVFREKKQLPTRKKRSRIKRHFRSPPLFPSLRIGFRTHYVQRRKARVWARPWQERATYFDSDLTRVGCWHSAFSDKKDKDRNAPLWALPGDKVSSVCFFFFSHLSLHSWLVQGSKVY